MSKIFVSHSSTDKAAARRLVAKLKEWGYADPFLDFDAESGIKGGRRWERELYRSIRLSHAVIVLCSPHSMTSPWCFFEIAEAKALNKDLFPLKIAPCEVVDILKERQVIDVTEEGEEEAYGRLSLGLRAAGLDPNDSFTWDPTRTPPFPGFRSFEAQDAGIYFGRDAEVHEVIEKLRALDRPGEARLLVVVGSSGSGKSSLVRAGVIPRLKKAYAWLVVPPFRPSGAATPLDSLRLALAEAFDDAKADPGHRPAWLAPDATSADLPPLEVAGDQLRQAAGRREAAVLFVIDQAEELLQTAQSDEAEKLLTALLRALDVPGGRVFALATLRSDFLGSFQNHDVLRGVKFANVPLGLMPLESFPQVIEGPAARAEIALEPGLVPLMVQHAKTGDALPLLAFTLRELWERCKDDALFTLKAYRDELGGIQGAVAQAVARIKSARPWTPEVTRAAQRAFLKLARVNDEGQFLRRRARWRDLPDLAAPILERFVEARLLSSDGDSVEVVHESLFRVWPELSSWLEESRAFLLWEHRVRGDAGDWDRAGQPPSLLIPSGRLAEARKWIDERTDDLQPIERDFVRASIAERDRQADEDRLRQQRELETQRQLREEAEARVREQTAAARKQQRLMRGLWIALAGAAVLATAATIAFGQARLATQKARIATIQRQISQATTEFQVSPTRGLLLAVEALNASRHDPLTCAGQVPCVQLAAQALVGMLSSTGGTPLIGHKESVVALSFTGDGKLLATADERGTANLWRVEQPQAPLVVLRKRMHTTSVALSADGKFLATAGFSFVSLFRIDQPSTEPYPFQIGDMENIGAPTSVAFSGDSRFLLMASGAKSASLRQLDQLEKPIAEWGERFAVKFASLTSDGKFILILDDKGKVWRWRRDQPDGQHELVLLNDLKGSVQAAFFSPDGSRLLVPEGLYRAARLINLDDRHSKGRPATNGGGVSLIKVERDGEGKPRPVETRAVRVAAFSADGKFVAVPDEDGTVRVWEANHPDKPDLQIELRGHEGPVYAASFSPDGRQIATAGRDRTARLWRFDQPMAIAGGDRSMESWMKRLEELVALASTTAGRNLTKEEWDQFFPDEPFRPTFPDLPAPEKR